jgi:hypothetical protein
MLKTRKSNEEGEDDQVPGNGPGKGSRANALVMSLVAQGVLGNQLVLTRPEYGQ